MEPENVCTQIEIFEVRVFCRDLEMKDNETKQTSLFFLNIVYFQLVTVINNLGNNMPEGFQGSSLSSHWFGWRNTRSGPQNFLSKFNGIVRLIIKRICLVLFSFLCNRIVKIFLEINILGEDIEGTC